jgi:ABC-2 type transport system permease protein
LALAGLAGVPYHPVMVAELAVRLLLLSFAFSAFGMVVAARVHQTQAIMGVMSMLVMPLFFLSGALYPPANLPGCLRMLARLNPLTYAVTGRRQAIFRRVELSAAARRSLDPALTWFGRHVPAAVAVATVAILGLGFLRAAISQLRGDG